MADRDTYAAPGEVVPLATFSRALRYRWPLVLLVTLLGLGLGLLLANARGGSYAASTTVQINRGLVGGDVIDLVNTTGVNARSEGQVAASTAVATRAKQLLGSAQAPERLLDHVNVEASQPSSSLTITFDATSPTGAADGANAFADAYLQVRTQGLNALLERSRQAITTQQDRVVDGLALRPSAPNAALQAQLTDNAQRLSRLASVVVDPGAIISRASSASTNGLPPIVFPLAGALIGFLLGWTAAVLREGRRGVVRSDDDLRHFDLPVLGRWSAAERDRASVGARLALQLRGRSLRSVVVSEPQSGAAIAPDLAQALTMCGVSAGVSGADDPAPQRHAPATEQVPAPEPVAAGRSSSGGSARVGPRGLDGPSVPATGSPAEAIFGSSEQPRTSYSPFGADVTLLSVPSLLTSSVGLLQAADVGGVVLACRRGRTRLADLSELLPDLRRADVDVLGVILL